MRKPVVMSLLTVWRIPAPISAYLPTRIASPSCNQLLYLTDGPTCAEAHHNETQE